MPLVNTTPVQPQIGISGYYEFAAPFDSISGPTNVVRLMCVGLFKISTLIMSVAGLYETVYKPRGIANTKFDYDVLHDVVIVGFTDDNNITHYVPLEYVTKAVDTTLISHNLVTATFDMGLWPTGHDFTALKTQLEDMISATIGSQANIRLYVAPNKSFITPDAAALLVTARDVYGTLKQSYYQLNYAANEKIQKLNLVIASLITKLESFGVVF